MLNDAQMKKLQKQVGKKVDVVLKKREEEEKKVKEAEDRRKLSNLIEMRKEAQILEDLNKDRGTCFVLWEGVFYGLNHETNKMQMVPISLKERFDFDEPCKESNGKRYYFLIKGIYEQQKKLLHFMSENYATVKFAVNSIGKVAGKESLISALSLNGVFEKFQAEFPNSSMADFIECFRSFENLFLNSLK